MGFYTGKKVFISGGSSGIGKAAAIQLAREGASVMIAARTQQTLDEALEEIKAAASDNSQHYGAISLDVTDKEAVVAAAAQVLEEMGGLDVLVANQGYAITGHIQDLPLEAFDELIQTNYLGHVYLCQAFIKHFVAQKSGRICLVSSVLGFIGIYGYAPYCGSKYALTGYGWVLRNELAPHGVKVSIYYPTTTLTPGLEKENLTKPAETWHIEGTAKAATAEAVAGQLVRITEKGRFESVYGFDNWVFKILARRAPWFANWIMDMQLRSFRKKHPDGAPPPGAQS